MPSHIAQLLFWSPVCEQTQIMPKTTELPTTHDVQHETLDVFLSYQAKKRVSRQVMYVVLAPAWGIKLTTRSVGQFYILCERLYHVVYMQILRAPIDIQLVYIYIYTCICTYTCVYIYILKHISKYACKYKCKYIHMCKYISKYKCKYICKRTCK